MKNDFLLESGQKFISNVLGGAGAIWGSSEVIFLRNQNNRPLWRGIAYRYCFFGLYLKERITKYEKYKKIKKMNKIININKNTYKIYESNTFNRYITFFWTINIL